MTSRRPLLLARDASSVERGHRVAERRRQGLDVSRLRAPRLPVHDRRAIHLQPGGELALGKPIPFA